jgi:hypothetical protein
MASISSPQLVDAVLRVKRMSFADRQRLAEDIHAVQPNLFFSVLVLQRYGATIEHIEMVLNECCRQRKTEPRAEARMSHTWRLKRAADQQFAARLTGSLQWRYAAHFSAGANTRTPCCTLLRESWRV